MFRLFRRTDVQDAELNRQYATSCRRCFELPRAVDDQVNLVRLEELVIVVHIDTAQVQVWYDLVHRLSTHTSPRRLITRPRQLLVID